MLAGAGDDPIKLAQSAVARGDGIAAEVAARRALDRGAPRAAVAAYMGEALVLQGNQVEALRWLEPGEFDGASAEAGFRTLGRLQTERGNYGAAAEAFNRLLAAGRESAGLWVDVAQMRYRSGEQHIVGDAINRALALDPKNSAALSMQAQLQRDARGLVASLLWFERAIELSPNDVGLLGQYAATLGELGRYKDMLKVVRRMHAIEPGFPQIYYLQAVLAARAGKDDLARRLLWRAGKDISSTPAGLVLQGVLDFRSGHPSLAVEKFAEVARRQPDNMRVTLLLGRALVAADDLPEAVARLSPLAERPDASPYLLTLLARAYEQLGQRERAAPLLDRASRTAPPWMTAFPMGSTNDSVLYRVQDDPNRPDISAVRLRSLLAGGNVSEARRLAGELERRFTGAADIETLAGDAALLAGDPASALASYLRAGEVRQTLSLTLRMAAAMRADGRADEARNLITAAFVQNPQDATLAQLMGHEALGQGDRAAAVRYWQLALKLGRIRDPSLLVELAQIQIALGDTEGALDNARRAYALQRSNPRATAALADALEARGAGGAEALRAKARRIDGAP